MFIKYIAIISLCVSWVVAGEAMSIRYELLEKAIKGDSSFRIRAINEIGDNISDKEYQKLLVEYLFSDSWDDDGICALIRAFSKSDPSITNLLIERYKSSERKEEDFIKVCTVLEKIGGPRESVRQFYLEESKLTSTSEEKKAWLRICFLNWGVELKNNLKQLKLDIKNIKPAQSFDVLYPLSMIGCQKFADKELSKILTHNIESSDVEISCLSALILSSTKNISSEDLTVLKKNTNKSINPDDYTEDYNGSMLKNMCIATLDKKQSEERVRIVLHNTGCKNGLFDHSSPLVILLACNMLVDKPIREIIEKSLSDSDPNIVRGALLYVYCLGYECKDVEPVLFQLLENSKDEDTRRLAACALAVVAEQDRIPRLETILKNEKSNEVREQICDTIGILNMDLSYKDKKEIEKY